MHFNEKGAGGLFRRIEEAAQNSASVIGIEVFSKNTERDYLRSQKKISVAFECIGGRLLEIEDALAKVLDKAAQADGGSN